jgi:hypothetical protein
MGDRYTTYATCPSCKRRIFIYYAPSCEIMSVKCECGKIYDILLELKLKERKKMRVEKLLQPIIDYEIMDEEIKKEEKNDSTNKDYEKN